MPDEKERLAAFLGQDVVLDTRGPLVYLGRLAGVDEHFFALEDVDVHDLSEGATTKERYVLDARKHGIKKSRAAVLVRKAEVMSLSRLEDVIPY
jgi:small nuclear ribonucleoprotein (snRNP)-like protein